MQRLVLFVLIFVAFVTASSHSHLRHAERASGPQMAAVYTHPAYVNGLERAQ